LGGEVVLRRIQRGTLVHDGGTIAVRSTLLSHGAEFVQNAVEAREVARHRARIRVHEGGEDERKRARADRRLGGGLRRREIRQLHRCRIVHRRNEFNAFDRGIEREEAIQTSARGERHRRRRRTLQSVFLGRRRVATAHPTERTNQERRASRFRGWTR